MDQQWIRNEDAGAGARRQPRLESGNTRKGAKRLMMGDDQSHITNRNETRVHAFRDTFMRSTKKHYKFTCINGEKS